MDPNSFAAQAIAAYKNSQKPENSEKEANARREVIRQELQKLVVARLKRSIDRGNITILAEPLNGMQAKIENVTVALTYASEEHTSSPVFAGTTSDPRLVVVGACANCGEPALSGEIHSIEDVGEFLMGSAMCDRCQGPHSRTSRRLG